MVGKGQLAALQVRGPLSQVKRDIAGNGNKRLSTASHAYVTTSGGKPREQS